MARCICGKTPYRTQAEAESCGRFALSKRPQDGPLYSYLCQQSHRWHHLTRFPTFQGQTLERVPDQPRLAEPSYRHIHVEGSRDGNQTEGQ